jgi:anti-sigma regulatory factor (Ser/Thr protein kinase)
MDAVAVDGPGEPFEHPALFYRGDAEYLAGTVPFVFDGLAAGDPVAVSVPGPRLELLRAALGSDADRVRLHDMTEVGRNPGRIISEVLLAAAEAHPDRHVRIIGEPIWAGRSALEYPACLQHEALINLAFRGRRATILCPYDVDGLDDAVLADAAETHPVLVEQGSGRLSDAYDWAGAAARGNVPLPEPPPTEVFAFDPASLSAARRFAATGARRVGLHDEDRLDDFVLAIGELAANSIRYGGGRGLLRVWAQDGLLTGEVRDAGRIDDPLAGRRRVDDAERGGRGLRMVHSIADLVRTYTGPDGTTTRVHLLL